MPQALSAMAAKVTANAAAVATAMGGGTTTAEAAGLAEMLSVLGRRNDLSINALQLANKTLTLPIPG